jgi:hypothetical protein
VDHIQEFEKSTLICRTILHGKKQTARVHDFLNLLCTSRAPPPHQNYCYFFDHQHFVWYDSSDRSEFKLYMDTIPLELDTMTPPPVRPFLPNDSWNFVASKFTYHDEVSGLDYVEYIEPLVAQLRFPLAECLDNDYPLLADFASYVIPPTTLERNPGRTLLYDVGSKDWSSMEYIVEEWGKHGIPLQHYQLFSFTQDGKESRDEFLKTVPEHHQGRIVRTYMPFSAERSSDKLYLPDWIQTETNAQDYVMVKLDRQVSASVKQQWIQDIVEDPKLHVDELFWEINAQGNYVMQHYFDTHLQFDQVSSLSLSEAYRILSRLRQRGIRAHAWI